MNPARPPGEQGGRADEIGAGLQRDAALGLGVLQRLDGGEVPVDQHGVGERPQMFGRLQFGGMGRQKEQMDMLRDTYFGTLTLHGGSSPMGSQANRLMGCLFHPSSFAPEGGAPAYMDVTSITGWRG